VWNFGIYAPTAQITDRTAFLVQGDGALEAGVSTPTGWMVAIEPGRMAVPRTAGGFGGYMANGPGEELIAAAYDWQGMIQPTQTAPGWLPRIQCAKTSIHV
jgi:alpha-L-rhamnosidase